MALKNEPLSAPLAKALFVPGTQSPVSCLFSWNVSHLLLNQKVPLAAVQSSAVAIFHSQR
jgi:hypothetical protein